MLCRLFDDSKYMYIYRVPTFFPNTKFQVFSWFLVLNSIFFQVFLCQIPGTFIQILVTKISKCVKTDAGFPLLLWHKIPCIFRFFPGKSNEIQGQFDFESELKFQVFTTFWPGRWEPWYISLYIRNTILVNKKFVCISPHQLVNTCDLHLVNCTICSTIPVKMLLIGQLSLILKVY